ncbi:MAG: ABC transporter permease subunit [Deltaproteobacteria bacterium]|nr:ABC transporter permease subunit [Deltaproteobacteria bacterium]
MFSHHDQTSPEGTRREPMTMYRHPPHKRAFGWPDLLVLAVVAALIYGLMGLARQWVGGAHFFVNIDLAPSALPKYAFFSLMRAVAAYFLSLGFTFVYGYIAAKSKHTERVMIPMLDILQSIPVLGFLPGLVLGMIAVFPNNNVGLELACIIMIFTGQAWNMTFGFYQSLKSVPAELREVSRVIRLSWWEKVKFIELPFSAISLAWNSLMSMAGGWFFLTVCESFTLGSRRFQLPGIGSYMAAAIEQKNHRAEVYGVLAMCLVIIFCDFVIWRPVMTWVRKFQMEEIQEEVADLPFVTTLLRESWLVRRLKLIMKRRERRRNAPLGASAFQSGTTPAAGTTARLTYEIRSRMRRQKIFDTNLLDLLAKLGTPLTIVVCVWGGTRLWEAVRTLTPHDWRLIWGSVGLTLARVAFALVFGSLWAIPVGILIGLSPRLTRFFQPIIQVAASFPAPMLYPIVTAALLKSGLGFHWGSAVLMMLGAQWYVLFNVLAGAMGVTRDLKDSLKLIGVGGFTRWWRLYLPAAFPAMLTGWVTASGGAWNASIVAEYLQYEGGIMTAAGIGSMISKATDAGNFPMLAGCLAAMVITVVGLNSTFWRWLHDLAETRFRFER